MPNRGPGRTLLPILIVLAAHRSALAADPPCAPVVATVVSAQGSVELRRQGEAEWRAANLDDALCAGDRVRVAERSRAAVALANDIVLRLDQNTMLTLQEAAQEKPTLLELCTGAIHFFTRSRRPFRVITPFVNAAVEGTEVTLVRSGAEDTILVYEGQVAASSEATRLLPATCGELPAPRSAGGTLTLLASEAASVDADQALSKLPGAVVRPENAVQWALYYPPVIDFALELPSPRVNESLKLYREGKFAQALALIAQDGSDDDPGFFIYRAQLLLAVGRADEARLDIERALALDAGASGAYALQAIISVVQNDKDQALALATRAVELDPKSSAAQIALSYAQQANFDIEEAKASVQRAVEADPQNALAWARLAELEMSQGYLERALKAAERAAGLNPNIARTHTVLGFANLTRIDIEAAKASFERAIELDQADPLPRLGLGLAKIRESNLEAGRREIEIAASLDPADSLIRSYLGKAYFEERREELAGTQFDIAKELDPRDPTPWFYDAIRKQTENQPVEALRDLEKSIELNDNRAVYRGGLLLDQDEATRGASLARIYDDLGFDQLALVEASKSLSIDPANHSAHRFLSDTYATIPRHEIARVSELLQAQLLQPINVNPVQPRLSVTDLNIIAGSGPAEAAFNEFTPLFERNRPQFVVSGIVGNNDTWGDEAVLSGLAGRFSYSLGQFHYETGGFRENNDIEHDIYNVFAQYAVTPELNLQAELRSRETRNGDLRLDFDPAVFSTRDRRDLRQKTVRVGGRFSPSPQSVVIASLIYHDRDESQERFLPNANVDSSLEDQGYQFEAQHLFRGERFSTTVGIGNYRIDAEQAIFIALLRPPRRSVSRADFRRERSNAYVYANIRYPRNLLWTAGVSYDSYEEGVGFDFDELNPKFGLQWNITEAVRLRLAWFETVKPALVVDQTLEPTQIAGFNQFFDDFNGTRARRKGIGLDSHLTKTLDGGVEASFRDIEIPVFSQTAALSTIEDQQEKFLRAYLYWAPYANWALTAEYRFETFERDAGNVADTPVRIDTASAPLGIHYFIGSGFFAEFTATYVRQEVERPAGSARRGGTDTFPLFDAALGYRLPNRRGILSVEAKNLFDEEFLFGEVNPRTSQPNTPRFIPDRTMLVRLTLYF